VLDALAQTGANAWNPVRRHRSTHAAAAQSLLAYLQSALKS